MDYVLGLHFKKPGLCQTLAKWKLKKNLLKTRTAWFKWKLWAFGFLCCRSERLTCLPWSLSLSLLALSLSLLYQPWPQWTYILSLDMIYPWFIGNFLTFKQLSTAYFENWETETLSVQAFSGKMIECTCKLPSWPLTGQRLTFNFSWK